MKPVLLAAFPSLDQALGAIDDLVIAGFGGDAVGLASRERPYGELQRESQDPVNAAGKQDIAGQADFFSRPDDGGGCARSKYRGTGTIVQIPGVGPVAVSGLFAGAAGVKHWLAGCLSDTDAGTSECGYRESQIGAGKALVAVLPEGRSILAGEILQRHGGELSRAWGQTARW